MSEIRGLTDQAIDTNRPSRSSLDGDLPADPPSPLTTRLRAVIEDAPMDWIGTGSTRDGDRDAREWRARYEVIENEIAALASSPAPAFDPRQPHGESGLFQHEPGAPCVVCDRSSPAPAGLDVERLAEALKAEGFVRGIAGRYGRFNDVYWRQSAEVLIRAATRPAEVGLDPYRDAGDAGLRAARDGCPCGSTTYNLVDGITICNRDHVWRGYVGLTHKAEVTLAVALRAALASSPAPAGLDVEYDEEYRWLIQNDGHGSSRIVARDVLPEYGRTFNARAATRPAEDADHD